MSADASGVRVHGERGEGLGAAGRWCIRQALRALGDPAFSLVTWTGEEFAPRGAPPQGRLRLRERSQLRDLAQGPDGMLANAYVEGRVEVEGDLTRLVEAAFRASERSPRWVRAAAVLAALPPRLATRRSARSNARRHYDVGNEFYALWLDERMVYTCAYFPHPAASLEEAQLAKLEHVCRKLRLRPGEEVFEAGCGWGALALHMAERYGVRVRAWNVSSEQTAFAGVLGRAIARCLAPGGRGLLHFIGHQRPIPMNPWLERHIFPGAYIPALSEALAVLESQALAPVDVENLRRHYARTLEHWLERFEKAVPRIRAMRDERFERTWRLYLASSLAAFRSGSCQLYQILFAHQDDERLPWTRGRMHGAPDAGGGAA